MDNLASVIRAIANSVAFVILIAVSLGLFNENPFLALLLVASSLDQFEDVYGIVTKKRLLPSWFAPVDILFEGIATGLGIGLLLFGLMYYSYFSSWFFVAMMFVGVMIIISSLEDMGYYFSARSVMMIEVREKEKKFVRRK